MKAVGELKLGSIVFRAVISSDLSGEGGGGEMEKEKWEEDGGSVDVEVSMRKS